MTRLRLNPQGTIIDRSERSPSTPKQSFTSQLPWLWLLVYVAHRRCRLLGAAIQVRLRSRVPSTLGSTRRSAFGLTSLGSRPNRSLTELLYPIYIAMASNPGAPPPTRVLLLVVLIVHCVRATTPALPAEHACLPGGPGTHLPFCNGTLSVGDRVADLIGRLNLNEKAGLMGAGRSVNPKIKPVVVAKTLSPPHRFPGSSVVAGHPCQCPPAIHPTQVSLGVVVLISSARAW